MNIDHENLFANGANNINIIIPTIIGPSDPETSPVVTAFPKLKAEIKPPIRATIPNTATKILFPIFNTSNNILFRNDDEVVEKVYFKGFFYKEASKG